MQHFSDFLVVVSVNNVEIEHLLTHFGKVSDHAFEVFRVKPLIGFIEVHEG